MPLLYCEYRWRNIYIIYPGGLSDNVKKFTQPKELNISSGCWSITEQRFDEKKQWLFDCWMSLIQNTSMISGLKPHWKCLQQHQGKNIKGIQWKRYYKSSIGKFCYFVMRIISECRTLIIDRTIDSSPKRFAFVIGTKDKSLWTK